MVFNLSATVCEVNQSVDQLINRIAHSLQQPIVPNPPYSSVRDPYSLPDRISGKNLCTAHAQIVYVPTYLRNFRGSRFTICHHQKCACALAMLSTAVHHGVHHGGQTTTTLCRLTSAGHHWTELK